MEREEHEEPGTSRNEKKKQGDHQPRQASEDVCGGGGGGGGYGDGKGERQKARRRGRQLGGRSGCGRVWGGGGGGGAEGGGGGGEVGEHVGACACKGGLEGLMEDEAAVGGARAGATAQILGGEGGVEERVEPLTSRRGPDAAKGGEDDGKEGAVQLDTAGQVFSFLLRRTGDEEGGG